MGFEDIENDKNEIKRFETVRWNRNASHTAEEKEMLWGIKAEYYRMAGHFLHDHEFETSIDKKIWSLHAVGKTLNYITDSVKVLSRTKVRNVIVKLETVMYGLYKEEV